MDDLTHDGGQEYEPPAKTEQGLAEDLTWGPTGGGPDNPTGAQGFTEKQD